jgi:tetratricopeptide (TPR) repeat protein
LALFLTLCVTPPVRADNSKEAKAWFVKAKTDFEDGRYAPALEALKRAYSLKRLPLLLRYIGDCHDKLGDHREAIKSYRGYLSRSPDAPDRKRVERQIAANEDKLKVAREKRLGDGGEGKVPVHLMPTGKDRENPLGRATSVPRRVDRPHRTWLTVSKWAALGVAVGGLAMGITFNRLAAGKADDLRESIRTDCPPGDAGCGGNPDLNRPVVSYSLQHYELQRELKRRNAIAVGSFVVGGVAAASSAVLFLLDREHRGARQRSASKVSVTPTLGPRTCGLVGEVSFQ